MSAKEPIRVAILGPGRRSTNLYGPLVKALPEEVQLVGVWGRSPESSQRLGEALDVPWYTDLDRLVRETAPQIGVVSVTPAANGAVGLMAVEAGLNVLLETPIAQKLSEADAIIRAAEQRHLKVEVAEQYHRRPMEQIKLKLIAAGLFGRVYTSFNDFAGHGYHGMSLIRAYLGFDARPLRVTGAVRQFELTPHRARWGGRYVERAAEIQEHAMIDFEDGRLGIYHWTDIGYDSPLRVWRSSRFLAEKGMAINTGGGMNAQEQLSLLNPGRDAPAFITLEQRVEGSAGTLAAIVAHTGDPDQPEVVWENPFRSVPHWKENEISVADLLMSLVTAVREDKPPAYGPHQGRLDQELVLAMRLSSREGGRPVQLPLDPDTDVE